jgi:hypothetical protein
MILPVNDVTHLTTVWAMERNTRVVGVRMKHYRVIDHPQSTHLVLHQNVPHVLKAG